MRYFRFYFPDGDGDVGGNMGGAAAPAAGDPPAAPEDVAGEEEIEQGGTTPEEVAEILRGAGMNVPTPKPADSSKEEAGANPPNPAAPEEPVPLQPEKPAEAPKPTNTPGAEEEPSFKLEVEDAEGNKFEIENIEDLPEDFEPKNNRQGLEILDKLRDLRDERKAYEADKSTKDAEASKAESVAAIQESWNSEVKSLMSDKRIPTSADPAKNERVDQIYKFMGEENAKRIESNRPLIATIEDALNALEIKETREEKAAAAVKAKEDAKRGGGLVGGSSAPASSGNYVYRAGSARNSNEALRKAGLL